MFLQILCALLLRGGRLLLRVLLLRHLLLLLLLLRHGCLLLRVLLLRRGALLCVLPLCLLLILHCSATRGSFLLSTGRANVQLFVRRTLCQRRGQLECHRAEANADRSWRAGVPPRSLLVVAEA